MATFERQQVSLRNGVVISINNVGDITGTDGGFGPRMGAEEDTVNTFKVFVNEFGLSNFNELAEKNGVKLKDLKLLDWDHCLPMSEEEYLSNDVPREPKQNCLCIRCFIRCWFKEQGDPSSVDGVVFHFSSHGSQEDAETCLQFLDPYFLPVSEIFDLLSDESIPQLKGKPRVILIQACRAVDKEDPGHDLGVPVPIAEDGQKNTPQSPHPSEEETRHGAWYDSPIPRIQRSTRFPCQVPQNFLVVYSTAQRRLAYRDHGSWMEDEMVKALKENKEEFTTSGSEVDLLKYLTAVNRGVAKREACSPEPESQGPHSVPHGSKNVLSIEHRLTSRVVFSLNPDSN